MNVMSIGVMTDVRSRKVWIPNPPIEVKHCKNEDMKGEKYPIRELDTLVGKYLRKESLKEHYEAVLCEGEHNEKDVVPAVHHYEVVSFEDVTLMHSLHNSWCRLQQVSHFQHVADQDTCQ